MNFYENLTPEERLDRIAEILVRWIYRAEAAKQLKGNALPIAPVKSHYTLKETSNALGISKRTVQRWIGTGKLIAQRKLNRCIAIEAKQVEFLRRQISIKGNYPIVVNRSSKNQTGANGAARTIMGSCSEKEKPELKNEGLVVRKVVNSKKRLILKCPNDKKILGDLPDDFFDTSEEKDFYRNQNKVLVPCSRCKRVITF